MPIRLVLLQVFLAALCLRANVASPAPAPVAARFSAEELLSDVRTLASPEFEGRRSGSPGNAKARAWIGERLKAAGLSPIAGIFELPFGLNRNGAAGQGVNLAGLCKADAATDARVVVISAHYDHLGVRNGVTYPGADDNASGVAVLLALARQCASASWTHDVLFVAFDAEEQGLLGARAFVATPPIAKDRLALDVNLDMVSRSDKRELYVAGTHHHPELKAILEPVAARAPVRMLFGHDQPGTSRMRDDWTMQSDHGAFHAAGIPFVYFGVEDHADYHRPTDTPDKMNGRFFFDAAITILDSVTALDRALPARRP